MAKVREIHIRMIRKISDDNYGSFGVEGEIFLELKDGEDKDEVWAYGTSWLSAKLTGTHKAHGSVSSQPEQKNVAAETAKQADIGVDTSEYRTVDGKQQRYCPIHDVWMRQRSKDGESWFSHKDGDDWCRGEE